MLKMKESESAAKTFNRLHLHHYPITETIQATTTVQYTRAPPTHVECGLYQMEQSAVLQLCSFVKSLTPEFKTGRKRAELQPQSVVHWQWEGRYSTLGVY